ncbi:MAG TPA: CopG family transcriptional regulator [Chthonomonadaceae bacterium]|nr:CopG family transcriptional regulator [Chthonomonadaceae bacterium]
MLQIELPPDLDEAIASRARKQGTTPELLIVDKLREQFLPSAQTDPATGHSMADFLDGYIGGLHSGEFVPGGAQLSTDTGKKFTEILRAKHNRSRT